MRAVAEKKRAYCKNTVPGRQRGRKYPPKFRAEVVMAMLTTNSICAVARRYGVPESTIRTWVAEEARRGDVWAEERRAAAREIALRASLGTRAQVSYLQGRVEENRRAAQVRPEAAREAGRGCPGPGFFHWDPAEKRGRGSGGRQPRPAWWSMPARAAMTASWAAARKSCWPSSWNGTRGRTMTDKDAANIDQGADDRAAERAAAMLPGRQRPGRGQRPADGRDRGGKRHRRRGGSGGGSLEH